MTGRKNIIVQTPRYKKEGKAKSVLGFFAAKYFHDLQQIWGNGLYEEYYDNGNLRRRGRVITKFHKNKAPEEWLDGFFEEYYPNGSLASSGDCLRFLWSSHSYTTERGIPERYFYKNGQMKSEFTQNGSLTEYYENGQIKSESTQDGSLTEYYENGTLRRKGYMKDGKFYTRNREAKEKDTKRQSALKVLESLKKAPASSYRKAAVRAVVNAFKQK